MSLDGVYGRCRASSYAQHLWIALALILTEVATVTRKIRTLSHSGYSRRLAPQAESLQAPKTNQQW